ncbi:centrosome-associated protein ALMS1 isoform X2 [Phyllobates terribilis]|uniref:centrosome-associated protein ALMS1 isoform X2 n=1 Tax=Phyllobates terribilis TaxID=111132 RepID=UPI003CCAA531
MESGEAAAAVESWYQLPAEEDASIAFPTLSETVARGEHTDFPSLEEGTLLSDNALRSGFSVGRTHSRQLEVQDSRLSPCLPLLTEDASPGQKYFEDTLFQKTQMDDFAPLRATLDMSEFPGPPSKSLQLSDAVELASKEITMDHGEGGISVSQHYLRTTMDGGGDGGDSHPLSRGDKEVESSALRLTSPDDEIEPDRGLVNEDGSFFSCTVPAPILLGLLEKEVGMSSSSGTSSRRSSKSSFAEGSENINVMKQGPDPGCQNLGTSDPRITSHQLVEESFRDSSQIDFENVQRETEDPNEINQRHLSGVTFRLLRASLHQQLCSEIQERFQKRESSDATTSRNETIELESPPALRKCQTEVTSKVEDSAAQAHLRHELSMSSRSSIERGHKDTEMSHAGNTPVDEASFLGRIPHPISQSTPGTLTMNRKLLSGRIQQIKAKLTGSDMSLHEEPSDETSRHNVAPSAMPQSIQSSQGYPESSDSQRSLSPQRRRIQSLPSLNYIEKVGAWNTNTNQSFDALVLRGLTGVSPKKLAYNAVADTLNRMLTKQTSTTAPKKGLSASFKATSSMTNLSVAEKESSSTITRSKSYNSVLSVRDHLQIDRQPIEEAQEMSKSGVSQSRVSPRGSSSASGKWVENNFRSSSGGGHDLPAERTSSGLEDNSFRGQETSTTQRWSFVTMDQFSDVSLDQDYANSSHSSSHEKAKLQRSLTSAERDLTRGGENDWSPAEETSGKEELDIEERIPTYLRNLGIDQSPTTILTPFVPKGPILEPEFSPTDLRTIKGSTATPSQSMRLSEGGSQSAVNVSQSSLYSSTSTTSVSIPMGSEVGPESPLPTDTSPPFGSGSGNDRPISQDDMMARGVGQDLVVLSPCVEMAQDAQPIHDLTWSSTAAQNVLIDDSVGSMQVKQLIKQFKSGGIDDTATRDNEQVTSLQGSHMNLPTMNPVNDSFVGSNTLKEIQKLLAEADVGVNRTMSTSHRASPVGDPYTKDPRCLNLEASLNSLSASPLDLQVKDMSWDSSFNSGSTGDHFKDSSVTWKNDSLHSGDSSYLGELVGSRSAHPAPFNLQRQWGRSEPEGCSKATASKAMSSNGRMDRVQRSEQLLSNVSSSVGVLRNALAVTGTGYLTGREAESDESSGDSLAARVTSLLKSDAPWSNTSRAVQRADEEERKARGSVKLKLTSQSTMPDTELSEEDRRRIEEIKRELLGRAAHAEKDYSHPDKPASSGDTGAFSLRLTPSPFLLPITSADHLADNMKSITSEAQPNVTYGAMTKDVSSMEADQPPPTSHQDPISEHQSEKASRRNVLEPEKHDVPQVTSTEEATKPISSITFSSRKRSPPLSSSLDGGSPLLLSVLDKSPTSRGSELHPCPSPSQNVHRIPYEDASSSRPAAVDHILWRLGESSTQEFSARSWAAENTTAVSTQWTSAPSAERFSLFPYSQKENMVSGNVNPEGSLVINRDLPMSNVGGNHRITCSRLEAGGDGSRPSSSQEFQPKPIISSPTLKALSCIHLTISPKDDMKVLDVSRALVTSDIEGLPHDPKINELTSWSFSADLSRNDLSHKDRSAGSAPLSRLHLTCTGDNKAIHEDGVQFMEKENIPERLILSDRRRSPLFDATTQITTESPEKTTFSAEIFVEGSVRETSRSSIRKVSQTPERKPTSRTPLSCLSRATDQPLLLPYRPPGSPELFYVPYMEGGSRMSPVSTVESSHPGSNDAISPKFPPNILGSATEQLPDPCIPRHREGIYSKEQNLNMADWKQKPARGPADDALSSRHPSAPAPLSSPAEQDSGNLNKMSSYSLLHPSRSQSREKWDPSGWQPYPVSSLEDSQFLPLQPEMDYPQEQSDIVLRSRKETIPDTAGRTPAQNPGGLSHKSVQTPGGLSNESAQTPGGLSHKSLQTPGGLSHESAQTPGGLSHKSVQTPGGLSHESAQTPGGLSHESAQTPGGLSHESAQTPGGLSHESAQTPGGLSHESAQTPGGLSHESAQTPGGLSHESAQTPGGLSHESAQTPGGLSHESAQTPGGLSHESAQTPGGLSHESAQTPGGLSHKSAQTPGGLSHKSAQTPGGLSHKSAQTPGGLSHKSAQTPGGLSHKNAQTPGGLSHKSAQTPGGRSDYPSSSPDQSFSRTQSVVSHQSLDDLWARYTENRRRATESSRDVEVSLVERLERLARLLQNPPHRSLRSCKDEESHQKRETKKAAREQWYRRKLGEDPVPDDGSVGKSYEDRADSGSLQSDPMSEVRSTVNTTSTESQVGSDASSMTIGSTSVSTIDTIRLINAFGPERVIPSSRLGRLYSTISLQKKHTEKTVRGLKRASAGRGTSRTEMQELLRSQTKMLDAESVALSNCSWEPSPALRQKKSSRRLNKGVQAGELEIVMSGTRKNTRDVGTTFPSPGGERLTTATAVNMETNTRASKCKVTIAAPYIPPGLSWFVPAENLKSESRKENEPRMRRGPVLAWYEAVTSTKPWREPLREKNEQDQVTGRADGPIHSTRVIPTAQDKPFIKVSLQESLRSHRPDFIFRSGERVKRLQLLAEERRLQSVFQDERDRLFNKPCRSAAPQYKDYKLSQQNRTIPKKEMIQRSKRIYEQLPEIRKRKEEEKRRSEYETYRLKAQLFRKKVTNRILGRKTPWN